MSEGSIRWKSFALREWQPLIPSPECSILHCSVCDPEFHALRIRQTEWKVFLKRPINMANFLFEGEFCLCVGGPTFVCF